MEAMISTLSNNFREVLNRMPSLGEIRGWSSTFCQYSKKFELLREGILATSFNPAFAGGATMDIGTYTIYPMVVLFGMPTAVDAHLLTLPVPETGEPIDYQGSVMFDYPGMSASVQYSKAIDSFLRRFAARRPTSSWTASTFAGNSNMPPTMNPPRAGCPCPSPRKSPGRWNPTRT